MSSVTEMAFHGQWDTLLAVLRKSPERVNEASEVKGYTPLHQAAWHGASRPVIGELLELGADPRRLTAKRQTAQDIAQAKHPWREDLTYLLMPRRVTLSRMIRRLVAEQPSLFVDYDGNQVICDRLIEMFSLDVIEPSAAELPHRVSAAVQALTGLMLENREQQTFEVSESFSFKTDAGFWQRRFIPALQRYLHRPDVAFLGESWAVVGDLFEPAPRQWGLRGDLFLWLEMRHALSHVTLPRAEDALASIIQGAHAAVTGSPLEKERELWVPHLARGGMSSGMVSGKFWCQQWIPVLQQRLRWLRESYHRSVRRGEPSGVKPADYPNVLHEMPERHETHYPKRYFSAQEMNRIRNGYKPQSDDDKWFLYFSDDHLYMHRSWTGHLIFDVSFKLDPDGGAYVSEVLVNRDPKQFQDSNADDLLEHVICYHLLGSTDCQSSTQGKQGEKTVDSNVSRERVILRVGSEGGSITLFGLQTPEGWTFELDRDESSTAAFEDACQPYPRLPLATWRSALKRLDQYPWTQLYPLEVNPAFVTKVTAALKARQAKGLSVSWQDWKSVLTKEGFA